MATQGNIETGKISGFVFDVGVGLKRELRNPIVDALVEIVKIDQPAMDRLEDAHTQSDGSFEFLGLPPGQYRLTCGALQAATMQKTARLKGGAEARVDFEVKLGLVLTAHAASRDGRAEPCTQVSAGSPVTLSAYFDKSVVGTKPTTITWDADQGTLVPCGNPLEQTLLTGNAVGPFAVRVTLAEIGSPSVTASSTIVSVPLATQPISGQIGVALQRPAVSPTLDLGLWAAIRAHAKAISFGGLGLKGSVQSGPRGYQGFIERVLCGDGDLPGDRPHEPGKDPDLVGLSRRAHALPRSGMAAYELLKTATEIYLLWNCGIAIRPKDMFGNATLSDDEERSRSGLTGAEMIDRLGGYLGSGRLPYIQRVVQTAFPGYVDGDSVFCSGVLSSRVDCPCLIELIWSYWHEEGMLVQTMNAISRRFQNVRGPGDRDPLAHLEIDPLRPLNNFLWGYIQDEQNLLSVKRRAYEYDHHYGLTIQGKAVPPLRPADSRSKFLEGFHNLLHMVSIFYKEDNDTTVIADGFPLLNALREVHLLLAQGAHNQFGDLPWTARVEMMTQQWLLARSEMREFLQSRPMVPYTESWMPQVDTMKTLQGWSDVTVTHFRDLGVFGEMLLLSIRYGDWIELNDENHAKNWARYWRPEVQAYLHAYRAVTGVDLTSADNVDYTMPAVHLQKRLAMQRSR